MNNCETCGSVDSGCSKSVCLEHFHAVNSGCGADHRAMQPAPDQCIRAGDFLKCNANGLIEKWSPGDVEQVIGVAYKSYNVDENKQVDCSIYYINVWTCGTFMVPPHLLPTFNAVLCSPANAHIRKIGRREFIL